MKSVSVVHDALDGGIVLCICSTDPHPLIPEYKIQEPVARPERPIILFPNCLFWGHEKLQRPPLLREPRPDEIV